MYSKRQVHVVSNLTTKKALHSHRKIASGSQSIIIEGMLEQTEDGKLGARENDDTEKWGLEMRRKPKKGLVRASSQSIRKVVGSAGKEFSLSWRTRSRGWISTREFDRLSIWREIFCSTVYLGEVIVSHVNYVEIDKNVTIIHGAVETQRHSNWNYFLFLFLSETR